MRKPSLSAILKLSLTLFLSVADLSFANTENFKVTAPESWEKTVLANDVAVYKNKKSNNHQIVLIRTFTIAPNNITTFQKLSEQIPNIARAREKLLVKYGIFEYAINDKSIQPLKNSGFNEFLTLQSRFRGLQGAEVQVLERQYMNQNQFYQVVYFEESPALSDRPRIERILDNFKPIYQASRTPAQEQVCSGFQNVAPCDEVCELNSLKNSSSQWRLDPKDPRCSKVAQENPQDLYNPNDTFSEIDLEKASTSCIENTLKTASQAAAAPLGIMAWIAQFSDINGTQRRQAKGEQLITGKNGELYKLDRKTLAQANRDLKTYDDLLNSPDIKPLTKTEQEAELASGASLAWAELNKFMSQSPGKVASKIASGLMNEIGENVVEFRCVNLRKRMSIICEVLALSGPPSVGAVGKLAAGRRLASAEARPFIESAKKVIEKESQTAKLSPATAVLAKDAISTAIEENSARFVGKPYAGGPLGEGPNGFISTNPIVCFSKFDCTTYVETVTALSRAKSPTEFKQEIRRIRYHDSNISYEDRKHFTEHDWLPGNIKEGVISDVTEKVGGIETKVIQDTIDRDKWLHNNYDSTIKGIRKDLEKQIEAGNQSPQQIKTLTAATNKRIADIEELKKYTPASTPTLVKISYVPIDTLLHNSDVLDKIPSGSIFSTVRSSTTWQMADGSKRYIGTVVSHQGFLIRIDGKMYIRHAPFFDKTIETVPLEDYLKKIKDNPTFVGLNISKVNPR